LTNKLDRYAVIGNPVAHSKSPEIHTRFAAQTQQQMMYERLLSPLDAFAATVRSFVQEGGRGLNVTVPFKLEAHALAAALTERARMAGAVNTLKFDGDQMLGDNTDGVGLVNDIMRNAGRELAGKSILLLGAGGAARGVMLPLLEQRPACLTLANRTAARAQTLALSFAGRGRIEVSDFAALDSPFDLVINATAASLSGQTLPISPRIFASHTLAYDMMYGADPTVFMQFAAAQGAKVRDGLGMLVEQAAESFFLWRGVRPETSAVFADLRARV
jgi:shikimate dehydrogenase